MVLRQRNGLLGPIKKLRFYGDDGLHILAASEHAKGELRDFSLLNEGMSETFSMKEQSKKQLKGAMKYTEQSVASDMGEVVNFGFSTNRQRDWANVLTCHRENEKACIWSAENHAVVKQNLELWENQTQQRTFENRQITTVYVTECGNFGVIAIDDGRIIKVNMQSGTHQVTFHRPAEGAHDSQIVDL